MTKEIFLNALQKILENANEIDVWIYDENSNAKSISIKTKIKFGPELVEFSVNKFAKINDLKLRKRLTNELLQDFEKSGDKSRCFFPRHLVKAIGKYGVGEIAICFECSLFFAQINNEQFGDSFPDEKQSRSKKIFDEIIEKLAVDVR